MNLHKCIVHPGIRTSERFGRLNWFQRDLFYGLLSAANVKGGWFENNAATLRAALYPPCLGKVSERDLKDGLLKLREVELIKLWTGRNGRAYGAIINYRQKFNYGEELPDEAHPPGEELFFEDGPEPPAPPPPAPPPTRIEVSMKAPPAPGTHSTDDDLWLDKMGVKFPLIDVRAEFRKAEKRYPLGFGKTFFENEWLPKAEPRVKLKPKTPPAPLVAKTVSSEEAEAVKAEWRAMPEPPKDTVMHALWLEART